VNRRVLACVIAASCGLASCTTRHAGTIAPATPTYAAHVAPILERRVRRLPSAGQGAPFSLLSYQDAQKRARAIADVTSAREMPPWLPEPNDPPFIGERRLTDAEIATLRRWAETGATEGDLRRSRRRRRGRPDGRPARPISSCVPTSRFRGSRNRRRPVKTSSETW
jgi:hypothetical protein